MNINEEIKNYMRQIDEMGYKDRLNLNSKQTAQVIGVSPSTIEKWRKEKSIEVTALKRPEMLEEYNKK